MTDNKKPLITRIHSEGIKLTCKCGNIFNLSEINKTHCVRKIFLNDYSFNIFECYTCGASLGIRTGENEKDKDDLFTFYARSEIETQ